MFISLLARQIPFLPFYLANRELSLSNYKTGIKSACHELLAHYSWAELSKPYNLRRLSIDLNSDD